MQEIQKIWVQSLGQEDSLEKEMATHSWRIPWTEEPGGLQSMGLQRVRHDSTSTTEQRIKVHRNAGVEHMLCRTDEETATLMLSPNPPTACLRMVTVLSWKTGCKSG